MNSKIETLLANTPLFEGLQSEDLGQIAKIAVETTFQKGETIFAEGDAGVGFYVVAAGKVKIYKVSLEGKEQILHIYGPGNPFGEVPVFAGERFPANALALSAVKLLFFKREAFGKMISANPVLSMNMLAVLSRRLRQFTMQIEHLSLKEVPGRLASYLVYLGQEQHSRYQVTLPISKGQLASLLGTIPETLSRILNKMSQEGFIEVRGKKIIIQNSEGLSELATYGKLL